jgi:hypothetical protein
MKKKGGMILIRKIKTGFVRFAHTTHAKVMGAAIAVSVAGSALLASPAAAAEEGPKVEIGKLTSPVSSQVTENLPTLLAFIGALIAIGFVVGFGISLMRKGKRT